MKNWVSWVQAVLIVGAVVIVLSFFVYGMVVPHPTPDPGGGSQQEQTQAPPEVGDQKPGVPSVPIAQHETWPAESGQEADRQLDVTATAPRVQLPQGLGADLAAYWQQTLAWKPCSGAECATMKVPMDWEDPGKASLDIAVIRIPSAQGSGKGPLFVNPGGPGVGGKNFAREVSRVLGKDALPGYDIVAWDPRGSGGSTAVECGTNEETDAVYSADGTPDDEAEKAALTEAWKGFAQQCREASGELLDHVSTIENVRDLDLLRFLMGAEKLNYLGVSYGTYIGAMYAELFPERTGRLLVDSAVDITNADAVSQSEGFELAFNNYADWCASMSSCPFGDTREAVVAKINDFLHGLDATPIPVGGRKLTQGFGTTGVALFLYFDADQYPRLTDTLKDAMAGNADVLLAASDQLLGRKENGWDTQAYAFPAIGCLDKTDEGAEAAYRRWEELIPKAPVFAGNMGFEPACEYWTAPAVPHLKLTGKGAAPILVVGSTGDSATPYQHAVSMAQQLESGHLLTYDGPGHGAVLSGSRCVVEAVAAYFEDGTLPEDGKTCS